MLRIVLACAWVLLSACSTASDRRTPPEAGDAIRIYVVKHGWHTGIVVPRLGDQEPFALLSPVFGQPAYYEFGWGDRVYYPAEEPGLWLGVRALLWPTPSALHVVALAQAPAQAFPDADMSALWVSPAGYRALLEYLNAHFVLDERSRPVKLARGQYGDSRFFESHGAFHLFRTCNTWTAQALRSGGVPVSSFMALTAESVLGQTRALSRDAGPLPRSTAAP